VRAAVRFLRASGFEDAAALALRTRGPSGAPAFAHELRGDPWVFRVHVVERLRTLDVPPEYIATILGQALGDESPSVRRFGAEYLARWPDARGAHAHRLRELLSDKDEDVRLWAGISLERLEAERESAR
jgi:HEAT repeat protein